MADQSQDVNGPTVRAHERLWSQMLFLSGIYRQTLQLTPWSITLGGGVWISGHTAYSSPKNRLPGPTDHLVWWGTESDYPYHHFSLDTYKCCSWSKIIQPFLICKLQYVGLVNPFGNKLYWLTSSLQIHILTWWHAYFCNHSCICCFSHCLVTVLATLNIRAHSVLTPLSNWWDCLNFRD